MRKIIVVFLIIFLLVGTVYARAGRNAPICYTGLTCYLWTQQKSSMYILCEEPGGQFEVEQVAPNALYISCNGITNNNYLPIINEGGNDG